MMRVTEGRITTIEKLQQLIRDNALEVPTLHGFLKEFPWVLDPRWTLVDDEVTYSQMLREQFPEPDDTLEEDRRIDFLCVRESNNLVIVEIKRPKLKASVQELDQIEEYVGFMREQVKKTTDKDMQHKALLATYCAATLSILGRSVKSARIFRKATSSSDSTRICYAW